MRTMHVMLWRADTEARTVFRGGHRAKYLRHQINVQRCEWACTFTILRSVFMLKQAKFVYQLSPLTLHLQKCRSGHSIDPCMLCQLYNFRSLKCYRQTRPRVYWLIRETTPWNTAEDGGSEPVTLTQRCRHELTYICPNDFSIIMIITLISDKTSVVFHTIECFQCDNSSGKTPFSRRTDERSGCVVEKTRNFYSKTCIYWFILIFSAHGYQVAYRLHATTLSNEDIALKRIRYLWLTFDKYSSRLYKRELFVLYFRE